MRAEPVTQGKFRNSPCPCQSGKKWKKCCLNKLQGYVKVDNLWMKVKPV